MRFLGSKTLRSLQTLTLLGLILQGLILPPGLVYAKGGSSTRGSESNLVTFGNNGQVGGRIFYLDARQEAPPVLPNLKRVSDCETSSPFPSLSPSFLSFDGERSYEVGSLWNLNECGEVVPSLGLTQLSQMNIQAGDVLVVTHQNENGEVYEEEIDASISSQVWSGMKTEMAFVFGEGAGEFFIEVLGAALIGAGIVAIASLHAVLGVLLTVVALLVGVYLIGEYADRWMAGEYEEIGRNLVRDVIYLLAAYGGGRSVPILKRGVMALLRRMPKAKAFFGAMDQVIRSESQITQQIDDVLGEAWTKVHRNPPGSGGSRLRPIPNGGGVTTLSRPRVLPKTELVRKATAPAWKLNPAELQSSAQVTGGNALGRTKGNPFGIPGTYAEALAGVGVLEIGDQIENTLAPLEYGYAEGVGQHNVDRYGEYHLERQGISNTLGNAPRRLGAALAERSGNSKDGSSSRDWIYSQPDDDMPAGYYVVNFHGGYINITQTFEKVLNQVTAFPLPLILMDPISGQEKNVLIRDARANTLVTLDENENFRDIVLALDDGERFSIPLEAWKALQKVIERNGEAILWRSTIDGKNYDPVELIRIYGEDAFELSVILEGLIESEEESRTGVDPEELAFIKVFLTQTADLLTELDMPFQRLPQEIRGKLRYEGLVDPPKLYRKFQNIIILNREQNAKQKLDHFVDIVAQEQARFSELFEVFRLSHPLHIEEFRDLRSAYGALLMHARTLKPEMLERMLTPKTTRTERELSSQKLEDMMAAVSSGAENPYTDTGSSNGIIGFSIDELFASMGPGPKTDAIANLVPRQRDQFLSLGPKLGRRIYDLVFTYERKVSPNTKSLLPEGFKDEIEELRKLAQILSSQTRALDIAEARQEAIRKIPILLALTDEIESETFFQSLPQDHFLSEPILVEKNFLVEKMHDVIDALSQKIRRYTPPTPDHLVPSTVETAMGHLWSIELWLNKNNDEGLEELGKRLETHIRPLLKKLAKELDPQAYAELRMSLARQIGFLDLYDDRIEVWIETTANPIDESSLRYIQDDVQHLTNHIRGLVQTRLKSKDGS